LALVANTFGRGTNESGRLVPLKAFYGVCFERGSNDFFDYRMHSLRILRDRVP
jgi:hypothetical protein